MVAFPTVTFEGVELTTHAGISWAGTVRGHRVLVQHRLEEVLDDGRQILATGVVGQLDTPWGSRIVAQGPTPQSVAEYLERLLRAEERRRALESVLGHQPITPDGDVFRG